MVYSLPQLIVWVIVGLVGGTLAGVIVKRQSRGFGFFVNLALGLAGAVIGGVLFHLLGLFPNLDKVSVSMRDVAAALVGSLLVLLMLCLWQRYKVAG
jgi:uncharacterized membrane protein YeaQ/YmgE (transglycosylase-associated protein family)